MLTTDANAKQVIARQSFKFEWFSKPYILSEQIENAIREKSADAADKLASWIPWHADKYIEYYRVVEETVEEVKNNPESEWPCVPSGDHQCMCGDVVNHLLVDGTSVKLGPKTFEPQEVEHLMALNGDNDETTLELFRLIDNETRQCNLEYGTLDGWDCCGVLGTYTGQILGGKPFGTGVYTRDYETEYATFVSGEYAGFRIQLSKDFSF